MTDCHFCGEQIRMPRRCNFCERPVCADHRLPEKHRCAGLGYSWPDWQAPSASSEHSRFDLALGLAILAIPVALAGILVTAVAINAGIVPASAVPGGGALDIDVKWSAPNIETPQIMADATPGSIESDSTTEFDRAEVEASVHKKVNEIRENRSLSRLTHRAKIRTAARKHSEDMAKNDYFAHTGPNGDTVENRLREGGVQCRAMGENIAAMWFKRETSGPGDGYYSSNEELAEAIVTGWMESSAHRENLLRPRWHSEGTGVYKTTDGKVYATQDFCS